MEPFSLATFFVVKSLADAAIIGGASAAVTGFIGNATDRILCKQAKHFLDWQNKSLLPENHDVLKVLRFAMLKATTMLSDEVPEGTDTKNYKKELEEWITKQTRVINELEKWATWQPSVYNELDKFLLAHEKLNTPKENLGSLITQEWITYIEQQIKVATPLLYRTYFNDGFINKQGNKLNWHNIVLTIFTDTIKNPDDKLGTRAYRALNIRFQTETKQELKLLQIELKQGFNDIKDVINELKNAIPFYADIKNAWDIFNRQHEITAFVVKEYDSLRKDIDYERKEKHYERGEKERYRAEAVKLKLERDEMAAQVKDLIANNRTYTEKYKELEIRIKKFDDFIAQHPELFAEEYEALKQKRTAEENYNASEKAYEQAAQKAETLKVKHAEAAFDYAKKLNEQLNYPLALEKYRQAASLQPQNGLYLNALGNFLITMAHYNEAIDNLKRALKYIPADNPELEGTIYNNLGSAYYNKGEYVKAIDYYQKALVIDKKYHGEEHPKIAIRYSNLGSAYNSKGEYDKAIEYYQKALAIDKKFYGEEHPEIATRYNNLGSAYVSKGEYDKAIEYFEKALTIDKKYHGEEHPDIAIDYNNLGAAYNSKGEYDKAIAYFQKALAIDKKFNGEEHPEIAIRYSNLGAAYGHKGEYDKAIDYYQKALVIDKKYHDEEHPNIATRYNNLGLAYDNKGEYDKAIDYFQKALEILSKFHPNGHPYIDITNRSLAAAREALAQSKK